MLASMDRDGSLFDDAGADAVRALHLLGPHAAKPGPPIFETACLRIFTAMLDRDAGAVTEQHRVPGFPNHLVEVIDLLLGAGDELFQRLAIILQLAGRDDAWRLVVIGIDAVFVR